MRRGSHQTYRWALVTGATSGIGAGFAQVLPEKTNLLITARNEARLAKRAEALGQRDREVQTVAADLGTDAGRQAIIQRADQVGIDLLINNAGIGTLGRVVDNAESDEREILEVNVVAPAVLTRALVPGMIDRARAGGDRAGLIIVSSTAAFVPVPRLTTYAASKAFDLCYAEGLAQELREDPIDVLALCPGATRTEFGARAGFAPGYLPGAVAPERAAREAMIALGRRTVHIVGLPAQAAFGPAAVSRYVAARGLGAAMKLVQHWLD